MEMGRRVLGVRMTTKEVVQGELGLIRLSSRILLRLRFWKKLITVKQNRLVYQIYKQRREEFMKDMNKNTKKDDKNWCYWTWQYLKDLHLEHVWESEKVNEASKFNNLVSELIMRKEEREWREEMQKKSKLRMYRKIKTKLVLEEYVIELEISKRRQLTMLRGGTNKLRIEIGRRIGEKVEERMCNVCLCNEVEDEKHFILRCCMYVRQRVEMFNRIKEECEMDMNIERLEEEKQLNILIGEGGGKKGKDIRKMVVDYIRKANNIRKIYCISCRHRYFLSV